MNPIYFLPLFLIPLVVLLFNKFVLKNRLKQEWLVMINFVATLLLVIGSALFIDYYHDMKLNEFDLNADGVFSDNEITPEQQAMAETSEKSFINLALTTGLIFSFFYSCLFYLALTAYSGIRAKLKKEPDEKA